MQARAIGGEFPNFVPAENVATAKTVPYPWILNPAVDILFCCGGFLAVLLCASLATGEQTLPSGPVSSTVWYAIIFGNLFFSNTHALATLHRVYTNPTLYSSIGKTSNILGLFFLLTAAVALFVPGFSIVLFKLYTFLIIQHYLAQSYGITLLYCFKRNYQLNKFEKDVLHWLTNNTVIYAGLAMCTFKSVGSFSFVGIDVPFWGPLPPVIFYTWQCVLGINAALFAGIVLRKFINEKKALPFPALMTILTGVGLYVSLVAYNKGIALLLPAFFHGSQYLVITAASFIKERSLVSEGSYHDISNKLTSWKVIRWFMLLVVAGCLLWLVLPSVLVKLGFAYGLVLISIQSSYSFHHFILDGFIWKLRDPALRKLLTA